MNAINLNVKAAVRIAMDYVQSLQEILPATHLRLEEVELTERGLWLITLSFIDSDTLETRVYKQFEVDPDTKEVRAMRIRNPLAA